MGPSREGGTEFYPIPPSFAVFAGNAHGFCSIKMRLSANQHSLFSALSWEKHSGLSAGIDCYLISI
jgi:hypothetical protein